MPGGPADGISPPCPPRPPPPVCPRSSEGGGLSAGGRPPPSAPGAPAGLGEARPQVSSLRTKALLEGFCFHISLRP